jgi:hypothetical protein
MDAFILVELVAADCELELLCKPLDNVGDIVRNYLKDLCEII